MGELVIEGQSLPQTADSAIRHEQARLVRTIGTRFRLARELSNMSQKTAAERLGYSNPSKLSKVEKATDTLSVPLWLIVRASRLYQVSVDFLFGVSAEWDLTSRMTQEREVAAWVFGAWEKLRDRDIFVIRKFHDRLETFDTAVSLSMRGIEEITEALNRFIELNPDFDDMRGGSRLLSSINRADHSIRDARKKLVGFRNECRRAANEADPQLPLPLED